MSSLDVFEVSALLNGNYHYEIPEYQRGYRWREEEVETLISDINNCSDDNGYFLNVLILQKINGNIDSPYDIVDGQQRLTTISILKNYCGDCNDSIKELQTKNRSKSDGYFIRNAIDTAKKIIGSNKERFKKKLNKSRFFVYEIEGTKEDAAKVFERINTGKIPLSSAELLKADWVSKGENKIQQKIRAFHWQRIEELLQNDDFYFFICPNRGIRRYQATRMDYILELFLARNIERNNSYREKYEKNPIFLYNEIKNNFRFNTLEEYVFSFLYAYCYLNIKVRNYMGYLLYKKNHEDEFTVFGKQYNACKKWNEKDEVNNVPMPDTVDFQSLAKEILKEAKIEQLEKGRNDDVIRQLLLLAMVIRYTNENLPFEFVRYASTQWDIEHIHARNQGDYDYKTVSNLFKEAKNYRFFDGWEEVENFIENNLTPYNTETKNEAKIEEFEKDIPNMNSHYQNGLDYLANLINAVVNTRTKEAESSELFTKMDNGYYNILPPPPEEDWINKIGNLILLPESTNRGFGNWPYPLKCTYLKNKCEKQSEYIPFCVEEKYDIQVQEQVEWTVDKSNDYLKELKELFNLREKK